MIFWFLCAAFVGVYLFWRYIWFFRNPKRLPPDAPGLVSPADGTVVYVKEVAPGQPVISVKKGVSASVNDIVRQDMKRKKVLIGIFMSPFNVHYNRAPLAGEVDFVRHYPARGKNRCMAMMHWRTLLGIKPLYRGSAHVVTNERTVTKFDGKFGSQGLSCYVVQIAAKSVRGIESFVFPGKRVTRGGIFGMIRIGSQVDLVVPWVEGMRPMVVPGDKVRAGETLVLK